MPNFDLENCLRHCTYTVRRQIVGSTAKLNDFLTEFYRVYLRVPYKLL